MPEERFLQAQLHELFMFLRHHGVVAVSIVAQHGLLGQMQAPVDVSYLADNVVLLRYFEVNGSVRQAISIVKKRSGAHEKTIRELRLQATGIDDRRAAHRVPWSPHRRAEIHRGRHRDVEAAAMNAAAERVVVLAPTGHDAQLACQVLRVRRHHRGTVQHHRGALRGGDRGRGCAPDRGGGAHTDGPADAGAHPRRATSRGRISR